VSVLTVVKDVCAFVGVHVPTTLFGSVTDARTQLELRAVVNEMAQRIAGDSREWQRLIARQVFTGDGVTEAFPMPANYKRMLVDGNVWRSTSAIQPMLFISSADEWLQRRARGYNHAWGEWMLQGGDMHIWPIMGVGVTATFNYIDKNCVTLAGGGFGDTFMADTDNFRLDERLLKLGMIWQWKALKGSPYAEDMATFMDALTRAEGADKPAPILIDRLPSSVMTAYPYPTPSTSNWGWPLS
jgi:hypothetical protein